MKTGYSIRTWRMRLFCPEPQWLDQTEEYFREVVQFYYDLLKSHEELWAESLFDIQRDLEIMTLAGRDGRQPSDPLPMGKVPVYLRRAAINKAIATVKSILGKQEPGGQEAMPEEEATLLPTLSQFPRNIEAKITFFKGMYADLTDQTVSLKLWNGKKWNWTLCRLKGRAFPGDGQLMSPTLSGEGKYYYLNIPVKQENSDARTARERMTAGARLCSVRFTNTDLFAFCCVLDEEGRQTGVHTCRGGDRYRHECKLILERIARSRQNTDQDDCERANRKYYTALKNLSEHYAHQVSREILNFCKEQHAGIIVLPEYAPEFTKMSMYKSGNFSPLHLSSRIRSCLSYKAWTDGILVLELRTDGLKGKCAICGGKICQKANEYICENGHQGNRFLNDARNLGRKCQESFRKQGKK